VFAADGAGVPGADDPQNLSRVNDILDGVIAATRERVVLPLLPRAGVEFALERGDGVALPGDDTLLREVSI
jgi:hypothetical protein